MVLVVTRDLGTVEPRVRFPLVAPRGRSVSQERKLIAGQFTGRPLSGTPVPCICRYSSGDRARFS